MMTSHLSWLPVYFIFSSWLRFSSFILLNIIILVIPLPTMDDNNNNQHHNFADIPHHEISPTQTRQPTSSLANEQHLPWHQQYLNNPAKPCSFVPSARTRHHRQKYFTDNPDKWQQVYEDTLYLAMREAQKKMQHYHYPTPDAPLSWQYQQHHNNPAPPCSIASSTRSKTTLYTPLAPITSNPTQIPWQGTPITPTYSSSLWNLAKDGPKMYLTHISPTNKCTLRNSVLFALVNSTNGLTLCLLLFLIATYGHNTTLLAVMTLKLPTWMAAPSSLFLLPKNVDGILTMDLKKTLATKEMCQHSQLQLPSPTSDNKLCMNPMMASAPKITMNVCTTARLMKMTMNTALQPPMMNTKTLQPQTTA
jgi:hypothetical protein